MNDELSNYGLPGLVSDEDRMRVQTASRTEEERITSHRKSFDFDGYQVVRREFFAHLRDPSVTFNSCKFNVNAACLQKLPDATSIQVLINREKKKLALLPCPDGAKDSFQWCNISNGKRKPKTITCRLFLSYWPIRRL